VFSLYLGYILLAPLLVVLIDLGFSTSRTSSPAMTMCVSKWPVWIFSQSSA